MRIGLPAMGTSRRPSLSRSQSDPACRRRAHRSPSARTQAPVSSSRFCSSTRIEPAADVAKFSVNFLPRKMSGLVTNSAWFLPGMQRYEAIDPNRIAAKPNRPFPVVLACIKRQQRRGGRIVSRGLQQSQALVAIAVHPVVLTLGAGAKKRFIPTAECAAVATGHEQPVGHGRSKTRMKFHSLLSMLGVGQRLHRRR